VLFAIAAGLACSSAASAQIAIAGAIDTQRGSGIFTGERGFSLRHAFTLNENFIGLGISGCNADPARCIPGSSVSLAAVEGDFNWSATFDGVSYSGGCGNCNAGLLFQISGSVVLPPLAPTATATGRFTITGTLLLPFPEAAVPFTGSGTATLYLRSPSSPGFPNSWHVDRAVLRLDGPLPPPWAAIDVGAVGVAGGTTGSVAADGEGTFTVAGAGADIWGTQDGFQFAYAWPAGNEIIARVDAEQNTNPFAKAGVMFRTSFDADSAHVLLDIKPDGGVELLARATRGGSTSFIGGATTTFPVWLKLTEANNTTTAAISSDGQSWQTVGSVPFAPLLPGLVVTSHDMTVLNQALFSHVRVAPDPNMPAPGGWQQADVGAVGAAGSATVTGSQATVSGDGSDIWGSADSFHYVYQPLPSDGEIIARVTSLQNTGPFAKAGVMLRTSTSATAANVLLDVKPDGGIEFMARTADGAATTFVAGALQPMPTWLRLQRRAGTVLGWVSVDGVNWTLVGSIDLPTLTGGFIGLAVTSHADGVLATATFDSLDVNVLQPPPLSSWFDDDIGAVGLPGRTFWTEDGTFTVMGAGADIWGTADSFHFLLSSAKNPTSMSARVVFETNTNPFAKAGIMLRNGFLPNSAFVLIDLKPNGEIEVLQRAADGGAAAYVGGAVAGFPTYLKLARSGSDVTASYSMDGTTWTPVATVPATWTSNPGVDIGMAVTSHDPAQLNTSFFDTVIVTP
jgi:regulation of enolase protein 1 (concanavalin A-like superfamily)